MTGSVVAVVGSINADLVLEVDELPVPGETVLATSAHSFPGGKGANQAVAVARSGRPCVLIGAVGDDEAGRRMTRALDEAHVVTDEVRCVEGQLTGAAVVMVDAQGENTVVVSPGANLALGPAEVSGSLAAIEEVAVVLSQAELSAPCVEAAAHAAVERDARFVLNLAPYQPMSRAVLAACDPVVVNEGESIQLARALGINHADPIRRAQALAGEAASVVITLGARGAVHADRRSVGQQSAPQVTVIDSTGAGDAFVAALVGSLADGQTLEVACREGVDAGSACVQSLGARVEPTP